MLKILCVVLITYTLVQASPFHNIQVPTIHKDPNFFKKIGEAALESLKEKNTLISDKLESVVDFGEAIYNHAAQSIDNKKKLIKLPFNFGKKVFEIIINKEVVPPAPNGTQARNVYIEVVEATENNFESTTLPIPVEEEEGLQELSLKP